MSFNLDITFTFFNFHSKYLETWSSLDPPLAQLTWEDERILRWGKGGLGECKELDLEIFQVWVAAGEVDRSYVHCKLCLDDGQRKKGLIVCLFVRETYTCSGQIKYCGGTTNMTNHLKACHKEGYKSLQTVEAPILVLFMISGLLKKITYFANLRRVKINRRLIGAVFY